MNPTSTEKPPQRSRVFFGTALWSFAAKGAAGANLLLSMPLVLGASGKEQFGAWATMSSFVALTAFLDFGLGNSAHNLISDARGRTAKEEEISILKATTLRALRTTGLLSLLAILLVLFVPWVTVLGLPVYSLHDAKMAAAIVVASIVINIPLGVCVRMQVALDQGAKVFKWQAVGHALSLCSIYLICKSNAATLALLSAAAVVPGTLCTLVGCADMLRRSYAAIAAETPMLSSLHGRLGTLAAGFFVLQLSAALAYSSDLAIVSSRLGAEEAANYAAAQRIFSMIPIAAALIWTPLWPQYSRALAAGEHAWVKRTFKRSLLLAVCSAGALAGALLFLLPWVFHFLAIGQIDTPPALNAGLATWVILECVGGAIATLLNAGNVVRFQLIIATAFAMSCWIAKVLIAPSLGSTAIPWVTCVGYIAMVLAPTWLFRRKLANLLFRSY